MSKDLRKMRKLERLRAKELRKDRLIQTRVDRRLQKELIEQARVRRMSVSNLVRNTLEDAFGLTDPEPPAVHDAPTDAPVAKPTPDPLGHIYAWNQVVLGHAAQCSRCDSVLEAGQGGLIGLTDATDKPRAWLCESCSELL